MHRFRLRFVGRALATGFALSIASCDAAPPAPPDDAGFDAGATDAGVDAGATDAGGGGSDASVDSGGDASTEDAMTDPCALGCPTDLHDVDANPLTGACGCEYACTFVSATDAYDDAFGDENCDGGDGLVDACVYVSTSQGLDVNPGTRTQPVQTISAALAQAQANSLAFVCLSGEVYLESYTVPSGIVIVGGFDHQDPDFAFRRKSGITTTVNGSTLP